MKEETDMTIKEICEKYDLTQASLSKRFGVPYRTVQDWYAEKRTPPDYVVRMMEELLRIQTEEK